MKNSMILAVAAALAGAVSVQSLAQSKPASPPAAPPASAPANGGKPQAAKAAPKKDSEGFELDDKGFRVSPKRGVFVLPWEGGVGQTALASQIAEIAKEADKWGPGQLIVLDIKSPGGLVIEIFKIVKTIKEVRERHRVVVWVSEAISAAAVTSMQCEQIFFRSTGALGAAMMIQGRDSAYGEGLEKFRKEIGDEVERSGRPRMVFEAMVLAKAVLTYTKDPATGRVTFHDRVTGLPGEKILSDEKDNLTFNSGNALDCGFSAGTADTPEQLAKLLALPEWYEISQYGRNIAKKLLADYDACQKDLQKKQAESNIQRQNPCETIQANLAEIEAALKWSQRCPTCIAPGLIQFKEKVEQLQEQRKQLQKQLAECNKARNG
jgi:hypothetical protein